MGKVKQAIQEVEEEVISLVKTGTSLRDIYACLGGVSANNPYLLDKELIKKYLSLRILEIDRTYKTKPFVIKGKYYVGGQ